MLYIYYTFGNENKSAININKGKKSGYESNIILTHTQINQTIITNEAIEIIVIKNSINE